MTSSLDLDQIDKRQVVWSVLRSCQEPESWARKTVLISMMEIVSGGGCKMVQESHSRKGQL